MKYIDSIKELIGNTPLNKLNNLGLKEGLIVGSSSGTALAAALKLAERIDQGNIVRLFSDRGDRYISKGIFE